MRGRFEQTEVLSGLMLLRSELVLIRFWQMYAIAPASQHFNDILTKFAGNRMNFGIISSIFI